jgi:hypothetical protein
VPWPLPLPAAALLECWPPGREPSAVGGSGVERRGQPDRSRTGADDGSAYAGAGSGWGHGSAGAWRTAAATAPPRSPTRRRSAAREFESRPVRLCITAGVRDSGMRPGGLRESGRRGSDLWSARCLATG